MRSAAALSIAVLVSSLGAAAPRVAYAQSGGTDEAVSTAPAAPPPEPPSTPSPAASSTAAPNVTSQGAAPSEPLISRKHLAYTTAALAVVGVGVGIGFGVTALDDKSRFDAHPSPETGNAGNNNAVYADMAFGAAVILGITSAVLLLTGSDPPAPPAPKSALSLSACPVFLPHGGGAGAMVRF